jgi:hypothetical protein
MALFCTVRRLEIAARWIHVVVTRLSHSFRK